jgi:D-amino-acid oxidase
MSMTRLPARKVLIVGAGAIGLRTAVECIARQVPVVLQAPVHPLTESCSRGAGGLWMPFHCDDPRTEGWALQTLEELVGLATASNHNNDSNHNNNNNNNNEPAPLVEIVPAVRFLRGHHGPTVADFVASDYIGTQGGEATASTALPAWTRHPALAFQHLTVEMLAWQNQVARLRLPPMEALETAGYRHAWSFTPPIVNTTRMLEHMLATVTQGAVSVDVAHNSNNNNNNSSHYTSVEDMRQAAAALGCDTVVNCTGLGAAALLGPDAESTMVGARGVLLHFDRAACVRHTTTTTTVGLSASSSTGTGVTNTQDAVLMVEEPPWGSETHPAYLIPRGDTIVVGGTYLEGDDTPVLRESERAQLLRNAERLGIDVDQSPVVGEWVGHRPARPLVRCEYDERYTDGTGVAVFHNYGHGGSKLFWSLATLPSWYLTLLPT